MRGIYFLANNSMYDMTVAFLNSLRHTNPNIPLCFIPYDKDSDIIASHAREYEFAVWDDGRCLAQCDEISRAFHPQVSGHYRKLAIWEGPYSEFIYIDVDTIVLRNLSFVFDLLSEYEILVTHSNIASTRCFVWKDSINGHLSHDQIAFAANTGFVASKWNTLSIDFASQKLYHASRLIEHMELTCAEQAFLNLLIVTSPFRYSSLYRIAKERKRWDLPLEVWGGRLGGQSINQLCKLTNRPTPLLVHWAGIWREGKHLENPEWVRYRHFRSRVPTVED